ATGCTCAGTVLTGIICAPGPAAGFLAPEPQPAANIPISARAIEVAEKLLLLKSAGLSPYRPDVKAPGGRASPVSPINLPFSAASTTQSMRLDTLRISLSLALLAAGVPLRRQGSTLAAPPKQNRRQGIRSSPGQRICFSVLMRGPPPWIPNWMI